LEISKYGSIFETGYENTNNMRINETVIERIRDSAAIRLKLALALGKSENQVRRYINENSDDLTKAAALVVIREFTGLSDDQILESNMVESKIN
jgi:hypothetical protein